MTNEPVANTDRRGVVEVLDAQRYAESHPNADLATCGACGRTWDDAVVTSWTPVPSARCPFEYEHRTERNPA
jgi:hypothetical protein